MEKSTVHSLPNVDFDHLAVRLAGFALRVFAEFGLRGSNATIPGIGLSVEDFVWKVLADYARWSLVYDPDKGALFSLLARALRNDIIDTLRKAAYRREESRSALPSPEKSERDHAALDEFPSRATSMDKALYEASFRERVFAMLAGEPDLREVAVAILDLGLTKAQEIAEAVGISVAEYQNRKKRMRRRLNEFQAEEART
jgi:DNA-directed RNA polymerase specialized sigma24 family protein